MGPRRWLTARPARLYQRLPLRLAGPRPPLAPRATRGEAGPAAPGSPLLARLQSGIPGARRAVAGISIAALVVFGISVARAGGPGPAPTSSRLKSALKAATIGGVTVLTNAKG